MKRASLVWSNANIMAEKESRIQNLPSEVPRCLEPDHQADFRALLARHLPQQTTAHNKGQKTTFGSQFITHVLTNLSVNFSQGLRAMTRRFCAPWGKIIFSHSPSINNIQTVSNFYGVDSDMLSIEKSIFENYNC